MGKKRNQVKPQKGKYPKDRGKLQETNNMATKSDQQSSIANEEKRFKQMEEDLERLQKERQQLLESRQQLMESTQQLQKERQQFVESMQQKQAQCLKEMEENKKLEEHFLKKSKEDRNKNKDTTLLELYIYSAEENTELRIVEQCELKDTAWETCTNILETSHDRVKVLKVNYGYSDYVYYERNGILDHDTHRLVPVIELTPAAATTPLMKFCLMENVIMNYCTAEYGLDNSTIFLKMIIPRNILVYNWWSRRVFTIRMEIYVIDRGKIYFYGHKAAMYVDPGFKLDTRKC